MPIQYAAQGDQRQTSIWNKLFPRNEDPLENASAPRLAFSRKSAVQISSISFCDNILHDMQLAQELEDKERAKGRLRYQRYQQQDEASAERFKRWIQTFGNLPYKIGKSASFNDRLLSDAQSEETLLARRAQNGENGTPGMHFMHISPADHYTAAPIE